MTILTRRTGPYAELTDLQTRFDRMFEELFDRGRGGSGVAVDVIDRDDHLVVRADLPGLTPDEVKIDVHDDVLTVRGEHSETTEEKDERYIRRERRVGAFTRSIALPPGVDPDEIHAVSKNGVIEIEVPKPSTTESRSITVAPAS